MAKIDKSLYTKKEFKKLKHQRQLEKHSSITVNNITRNIVCLKHGSKYSHDYVNKLYNGVSRNTNSQFNFFCITEDATNINNEIKILKLPDVPVAGWWFKPYIFSNDLPIEGTVLYIDLDVVITNSIDKLFDFSPKHFCIIRDFNRILRPSYDKFNSSVMRFEKGQLNHLWEKFKNNSHRIIKQYHGDQDYIYAEQKNQAQYFPDQWIKSWKWEIRKNKQFAPGGIRGRRKFQTIENARAPDDCCIAVFHGDPNPHLCEDPYIKETWI